MLLHRFAVLTLLAAALSPVQGQTLLMQESFETPGGDYGYTLDPPNDCGCCENNDQWGRTTGTGAFTCAGVGGSAYPPGGISGTFYFGAEDTDDPDIQTPAGSLAPAAALILDTVRTNGFYLLELEVDLATPMSSTTAPSGFVPSGPFEADDAVLFQYAYNTDILAGNYTTFAALRANGDGDLAIDANGNGTIDGPALDSALTTFRFDIPGGGKFLSVRVLIDLDDAQEELALDRMGVYGCEPPTPPTGLVADTLICRGDTATIQLLGGSLGSWAEWRWYEGACGGPVAGSGTTLKVAPTVTTTYYVGPADGCVPIGACRAVTVQVREAAGSFTATTPTAACPPLLVSFEDQTPGAVAWQWSFPDGDPFPGVSTGSSPSFLYNVPGDYDVRLIVTDSFGCVDTVLESAFVDVREPNGSFTAITATSGCVPLLVQFDDTTPGAVSWQWSFPDGDPFPGVSTGASPFFLYSRFGDFDVQLIVTDSFGCVDTVRQADFVNAFGTDAAIGLSDTSGCNPLEVTFSDLSASYGGVTAWSWDFGDGTTSTLPAPVHTYTDGGVFDVTLDVTDANGCTSSASLSEAVLTDTVAPVVGFPIPAPVVALDASCSASLPDFTPDATVSDACAAGVVLTQSPAPGSAFAGVGTTVPVTITATDAGGNADSVSFTVTLEDRTAPALTAVADQTVFADAACAAALPDYRGLTAVADGCDPAPALAQSPSPGTALGAAGATATVWLVATDASGNADSISFTVTVADSTRPTVTFPAGDQVLVADAACAGTLPDYTGGAVAADNCTASPTVTQSPAAGTPLSGAGSAVTVWLTATDDAGNADSVSFTATLEDQTAPALTAVADQTLYADAACAAVLPDYRGLSTVSDACDAAPVVTQSPAPGTPLAGTGSTVVTLTATDASGNPASVAFNAVLADSTAPALVAVADQTLYADAACAAVLPDYTALAAATDNCDVAPVVTQSPVPGTPLAGTGATAVTLTATDADGNAAMVSFNAVVADTIAPTVAFPAGDQVAAADAACQATLPDYTGSAVTADACDAAPTVTQSPAPGTVVSGAGSAVTVVLTATDASGNADSTAFAFTVLDVTAPTLPAVTDQTVWLDAACQGTMPDFRPLAPATDACDAAPVVTQSPAPGALLSGVGTETITLTATDASGNPASVAFTAILRDPLPPTLTIPADTALVVDAGCGFALPDFRPLAGAADNCDPTPTVVQTPAPGTMVDGTLGPVTVEIRVTDFGGYFTAGTFTVSPLDASAPSLICPASSDVLLSGVCAAPIPDLGAEVVVADNCDAAVVLSQSPAAGTMLTGAGASATVTVTATDDAGNASTCPITVTLVDDEPPVIVCPADQTVPVDNGCKAELDDYLDAVLATDNCELAPVVQTPAAGTVLGGGHGSVTMVTMSTVDAGGFPATCSFTVTLADTTSPNWSVMADTTVSVDTTCTARVPDFIGAKPADDNCTARADLFFSQSPSAGTAIADTTWVTLITRDEAGNEVSTQVRVNVDNALFPVFDACPDDITVTTDAGQCGAAVDWTEPSAEGFCLTVATDRSHVPGETFDPGFHAVVYTATNAIGNTATCAFSVTVQDAEPPVVDCPGDTTIIQDQLPFAYPVPGATDNCGLAGVELIDGIGGGIFPLGTTVEVWQAVDSAGNATTCSFALTLERNPLPNGIGGPGSPAVTVYPNPAGDALYVRVDGAEGGAPRLLDALGRVQAIGVRPDGPGTPWSFDLRERPAGVYFVVVDGDGWRHAERVIAVK